jgi:glycosyltransferase involved in cell wall biosynthesis
MNIAAPLVSVVIPTYNRSCSLKRCLESLCSQSFANFEVVIADDGSTDNTSDVVEHFRLRLSIIYFKISNSGGPARPRNLAISRSSGEYIAFLDSDDSWLPTKLEECIKQLSNGAELVYHDAFIQRRSIFPFREDVLASSQVPKPVFDYLIKHGNPIINSSVVVLRSLLYKAMPIDESSDLIAAEDFDLWLRLARYSESYLYIPKPLLCYGAGGDNISSYDRKYRYTKYICTRHGFYSAFPDQWPDWALANLATSSFRLSRYNEACSYSWRLALRSASQARFLKFFTIAAISKLFAFLFEQSPFATNR